MEIRAEELYGFEHYIYGEAYYGSCGKMRFRVAREPLVNVVYESREKQLDAVFKAEVWFTPFSYEKTPEGDKTAKEFPFSQEGLMETVAWLNGQLPM